MADLHRAHDRHDPHDRHDRELIARAAAGDASPVEETTTRELMATCSDCTSLYGDLLALALAMRETATSVAAVTAPRDFRLSPSDAARLGRRGPFGWVPDSLRVTGAGARGRLATSLMTLGLVGLLVSAGGPALFGGGGGGQAETYFGAQKDLASAAPANAPDPSDAAAISVTGSPDREYTGGSGTEGDTLAAPAILPFALSLVAIVVGALILIAAARTRRSGP